MRIETKTFSSKISQRIFATFVVCALVPVVCVAFLAYFKVAQHLETQTLDNLRHAAKSLAKTLNDRLHMMTDELRLVALLSEDPIPVGSQNFSHLLNDRLHKRFNSIVLFRHTDEPLPLLHQETLPPFKITRDDIKHMVSGLPLLVELQDATSKTSLALLKPVNARDVDRGYWIAELNQNYLWATDAMENLPLDTDYCILDSGYQLLHSSKPKFAEISDLLQTRTCSSTTGHFEFAVNGEHYLASYTQVFLKPNFKLPQWTVVLLKSRSDVFATQAEFKASFSGIILLILMVVIWLSIINIRKNLVPIGALKEGAQRVAARDFSQPVRVSSHDEFKDLADVFNDMADALNHKFKTLSAKAEIDRVVVSTLDPDKIIRASIMRIADCIACQVYGISLTDSDGTGENRAFYSSRFNPQQILTEVVTLTSHSYAALARNPKYLVVHSDESRPDYLPSNPYLRETDLLILPVWVKTNLAAILWLAGSPSERFTNEDITLARQLADQVAVALSNSRLVAELQEMNWGALQALARAVDAKSTWTAGHSERVAEVALKMGKALNLDSNALEDLQRAAFLHDIGKIGVPVSILDKPAKLNDEEFGLIKRHPDLGAKIIEPINAFKSLTPMIAQHHERFDGKGYPSGLAGEQIHEGARILAVADVYDAISSDRPYRKGMVIERVLEIIQEESGRQFDPVMVEALLQVIRKNKKWAA
jgi:hypothetical protein